MKSLANFLKIFIPNRKKISKILLLDRKKLENLNETYGEWLVKVKNREEFLKRVGWCYGN